MTKRERLQDEATNLWRGDATDPLHPGLKWQNGTLVPQSTGMFAEIPSVDSQKLTFGTGANDINPYEVGPQFEAAQMGPWDSGTSAYDSRGPSAYAGLSMDPEARAGMTGSMGYFQDLQSNPNDAIAESDYQRARQKAELSRRASSEAALQNAEARGMSGSGDALLAQLTGAQGSAADTYQAGLERAAQGAARRDAAASAAGSMASTLGGQQAAIDTARAAGYDAYANNTAAGKDAYAGMNATHIFDTNKYNADAASNQNLTNTQRAQSVGDTNALTHNQVVTGNAGLAQQNFNNKMQVAGAATGQLGNESGLLERDAVHPFQDYVLPTISAAAQVAGSLPTGGKKA